MWKGDNQIPQSGKRVSNIHMKAKLYSITSLPLFKSSYVNIRVVSEAQTKTAFNLAFLGYLYFRLWSSLLRAGMHTVVSNTTSQAGAGGVGFSK